MYVRCSTHLGKYLRNIKALDLTQPQLRRFTVFHGSYLTIFFGLVVSYEIFPVGKGNTLSIELKSGKLEIIQMRPGLGEYPLPSLPPRKTTALIDSVEKTDLHHLL